MAIMISKLIETLQGIQSKHGDLPVRVYDGDGGFVDAVGVSIGMGDDDKAKNVTVCDEETMDAFR